MEKVEELLKNIKGVTCTASKKDEIRVMKAMLNDKDFKVTVYDKYGKEEEYCPSKSIRNMCASVMSSAAKIPMAEAEHLMESHEFKRSEAEAMIDFSKEYINTYLQTGRKLPLGGRKMSNISIALKHIPGGTRTFPKKVGIDSDGKAIYKTGTSYVKPYDSIKVYAPAPSWLED